MVKHTEISPNHPRAKSLQTRHNLVSQVDSGVVTLAGVLAQGRGEAFDYLLGEKTTRTAHDAIKTAAGLGIKQNSAMTYNQTPQNVRACFSGLSSAISRARSGADNDICFTQEERSMSQQ